MRYLALLLILTSCYYNIRSYEIYPTREPYEYVFVSHNFYRDNEFAIIMSEKCKGNFFIREYKSKDPQIVYFRCEVK